MLLFGFDHDVPLFRCDIFRACFLTGHAAIVGEIFTHAVEQVTIALAVIDQRLAGEGIARVTYLSS